MYVVFTLQVFLSWITLQVYSASLLFKSTVQVNTPGVLARSMSVCLVVCLTVCFSLCLSACLSVCLPVCLKLYIYLRLYVCMCLRVYVCKYVLFIDVLFYA